MEGIKNGEPGRPDHFQQITRVSDGDVFQTVRQRRPGQRDHRAGAVLRQKGEDARNRREQKERPFFHHQAQKGKKWGLEN